MDYKRFLIWRDYGYEGWHIVAQADTWDDAVTAWHAQHVGDEEKLMTEYVPLRIEDGRVTTNPVNTISSTITVSSAEDYRPCH